MGRAKEECSEKGTSDLENAPGSWLWEVRARATPQPRDRQAGFWQQGSCMVLGVISTTHIDL